MEKSKISVIVPAFNAEKTIGRCLESIIGGRYQNLEILVVNDGSTDNTGKIVARYQNIDSRIKLMNQSNGGVGHARSVGIRSCSGDFIAFCDADDWYDADYLVEHFKHITKHDADISQCRTFATTSVDVGNTDRIEMIESDLVKKFLSYQGVTIPLWDKLYKRNVLDVAEIENDCRYAEDLYMNFIASK